MTQDDLAILLLMSDPTWTSYEVQKLEKVFASTVI